MFLNVFLSPPPFSPRRRKSPGRRGNTRRSRRCCLCRRASRTIRVRPSSTPRTSTSTTSPVQTTSPCPRYKITKVTPREISVFIVQLCIFFLLFLSRSTVNAVINYYSESIVSYFWFRKLKLQTYDSVTLESFHISGSCTLPSVLINLLQKSQKPTWDIRVRNLLPHLQWPPRWPFDLLCVHSCTRAPQRPRRRTTQMVPTPFAGRQAASTML